MSVYLCIHGTSPFIEIKFNIKFRRSQETLIGSMNKRLRWIKKFCLIDGITYGKNFKRTLLSLLLVGNILSMLCKRKGIETIEGNTVKIIFTC